MRHLINIVNSTLASSVRGWRGSSSTRAEVQPEQMLYLFDREGDPDCRLVREAITSLNLDVMIMPCPIGGKNIKQLRRESGSDNVPMLFDANVEERRIGAEEIIQYLFKQYKGADLPEHMKITDRKRLSSRVTSLLRLNAGMKARLAKPAEKPLTLYSFESSPFCRVVRERLCELELPYLLITLGKQQRADVGPAARRMHFGAYKPVPNSKRAEFLRTHGDVRVPYLEDPNTGAALFESASILEYLNRVYAR